MKDYTKTTENVHPDDDFHLLDEIYAETLEPSERDAMLQQIAFEREQERRAMIRLNQSLMLIKRECSHSECRSTECDKGTYYGAIAV